jgi:hypothetical protein
VYVGRGRHTHLHKRIPFVPHLGLACLLDGLNKLVDRLVYTCIDMFVDVLCCVVAVIGCVRVYVCVFEGLHDQKGMVPPTLLWPCSTSF